MSEFKPIGGAIRAEADRAGIVLPSGETAGHQPGELLEQRCGDPGCASCGSGATPRLRAHAEQVGRSVGAYWRAMRERDNPHLVRTPGEGERFDDLPECQACHGTRWVRIDVCREVCGAVCRSLCLEDPRFGKAVRCPHCPGEVRAVQRSELAVSIGFDAEQRRRTFASFIPRNGTMDAYEACVQWAAEPDGWLVVYGVPGSGKTHLSLAAANALLDRLQPVHWWYAPDLVAEFNRRREDFGHQGFLELLKAAQVLLIDDLGAARPTDAAIRDCLEPLMNYRERKRLPTLVTCIGSPEAIKEAVSESIGRRFDDARLCRVVAITADQYRQQPAA